MDTNTNTAAAADDDDATTTTSATPMFKRPDELVNVMPHYEESTAVDQAVHRAIALMEEFASSSSSSSEDKNNNNNKTTDNPWNNPDQIYQQLDQARHEIVQAWETLHAANRRDHDSNSSTNATTTTTTLNQTTVPSNEEDAAPTQEQEERQEEEQQMILRMAYMDMITDAFADVLEDLRQRQELSDDKDDTMDVETLVDCLQNGLDLLISSSSSNNNNDNRLSWSSFNETDFAFAGSEDNTVAGDDDNKSNDEEDVKLTPHESRRRQLGYLLVDQL